MSTQSRLRNPKRPNQQCRKGRTPGPNLGLIPRKNFRLFRPADEAHNYKPHGKFAVMSKFLRWLTGKPRKQRKQRRG